METLERSLVAGVAVNAATPRGEFVKFCQIQILIRITGSACPISVSIALSRRFRVDAPRRKA
jgi:hypothetical protein